MATEVSLWTTVSAGASAGRDQAARAETWSWQRAASLHDRARARATRKDNVRTPHRIHICLQKCVHTVINLNNKPSDVYSHSGVRKTSHVMQVGQLFNKLVACLTDDVGKSRDDVRRLYYSECVDALVEALTRGTDTQRQLINEVMTPMLCCALNF